jgi:putative transport protein
MLMRHRRPAQSRACKALVSYPAEDVASSNMLTQFLTQFPVVTLFGVIGIGYLLEVRLFGFRLGVAGVLFTGLAAGALGPGVAPPSIVSSVGLILFIHSIGIQFGPGFVNPFRSEG